ncbi:hypothetical protein [Hafnia phage Pocis76]|uniref:Uncharacterized protein n=1 Tax=Hafnia phage Pocis76 TaxID=2831174 RepID=A0A8E7KY40_9CAUD|nr:hypothetical protein [Hafnia phage Pocis76]
MMSIVEKILVVSCIVSMLVMLVGLVWSIATDMRNDFAAKVFFVGAGSVCSCLLLGMIISMVYAFL